MADCDLCMPKQQKMFAIFDIFLLVYFTIVLWFLFYCRLRDLALYNTEMRTFNVKSEVATVLSVDFREV